MKKINYLFTAVLSCTVMVLALSSCQKGFDSKTYAPTRPLPTFGGYSSSKDIETASLVAYWPFSGSLADSLSGTAGVSTATGFGSGVEGKGLAVSSTGYVVSNVPAAVQNIHSFTISIWVNMPQNTGATGLMSIAHSQNFWSNFDIFYDNGGSATTGVLKVHVFNNSGTAAGSDAWEGGYTVKNPWNAWTQIAVTYDDAASTVNVYYNGAPAGTNTVAGFAPLNWTKAKQMIFGTLPFQASPSLTSATTAQPWAANVNGVLDQARIYKTVLSASEVSALYNLEKLGR